MARTTASMYDPALGGINGSPHATPCGVPVSKIPWSVAHKTAPCGSVITITRHDGKEPIVQTVVGDRGPYVTGRALDLRPAVAAALGGSNGLLDVEYHISVTRKVNMKKYASLGGDAQAFEKLTKLVAVSTDKFGKQTDKAADKERQGPLHGIDDAVSAVPNFLGKLNVVFQADWWLRVGKILMGLIALVMAGGMVAKEFGMPIPIPLPI